ncbi:MAG: hypothetical protein ACTS73_05640 [Arsenophonus sp. NEOnobi-MAG3]
MMDYLFLEKLTNLLRELYEFRLASLDNNHFIFNFLLPENGKVSERADATSPVGLSIFIKLGYYAN